MEQMNYSNAAQILSTLVYGLGAGLGTWGIINLLDGYKREADIEQLTAEYRSRITEIDEIIMQLIDDKNCGRITIAEYKTKCAKYDAEMDECLEAIADLKAEIAAQKRQGLEQILTGGRIALISSFVGSPEDMQFALDYIDKRQQENKAMPV